MRLFLRVVALMLVVLATLTGLALPRGGSAAPSAEEFVVIGEVLKPEITVVISRENLNKAYELKLDESFLDKIVKSVERAPF